MINWFYYSSINPWKLYRQHLSNSKLFCYRCSIIGSVVVVVGLYLFLWSKSKQIVDSKIVKLPTSTVKEEKDEEDHTNVNKIGLVIPMTPWSTTVNLLFHPERPTCPTNHLWRKEKWSVDCYWNILSFYIQMA